MRSVLGFFSILALSVLAAGVLSVIASGSLAPMSLGRVGEGFERVDLGSFLLGLGAGVLVSTIARISWAELPRRTATWLLTNERNFARLAWAALFIVILVFY
jgi:hypothetical protein